MVRVTVRKLVLHVKNCIENSTSFIQKLIRNYQKVRAPTPTTKKNATKKEGSIKDGWEEKEGTTKAKEDDSEEGKEKKAHFKVLSF